MKRRILVIGGIIFIVLVMPALVAGILRRTGPEAPLEPEEAAETFLTGFFTLSAEDARKNIEKLQTVPRDDENAAQRYMEEWVSEFGDFTAEGLQDFLQNGYQRMNSEFVVQEQTRMEAQEVVLTVEEEADEQKRYTFQADVKLADSQGEASVWVYEGYIIERLEDGKWKIDGFKVRKSHEK